MRKLMLVSDYDGTLKTNIKNLKINIQAINKFREQGNIFTISTGRAYNSIKKECIKYNIEYDYLFCNDGLVLFDTNDNIIYKKNIDIQLLQEINSIISNYYGIKSIEYYNSYGKTDLILDDSIIQIYLNFNIINKSNKLIKYLKEKYPNINITNYIIYTLLNNKMDKSSGLEILSQLLKNEITRENIITVGDNYNDLTMLKDFNGYKVLFSYPFLYGKGLKTTKEVHTLIKKLEKRY